MTEAEWLACVNSQPMLSYCEGKVSLRKRRLFACACCRRIWNLIDSARARRVIEVAERVADGQATDQEPLRAIAHLAAELTKQGRSDVRGRNFAGLAAEAAGLTLSDVHIVHIRAIQARCDQALVEAGLGGTPTDDDLSDAQGDAVTAAWISEALEQARLLRDVVNPFRSAAPDPRWRTPTAVAVALRMYEARDFDAMPILADALMDAGCDSDDILGHCRGEGPHVRGCWVVDLVLGKM